MPPQPFPYPKDSTTGNVPVGFYPAMDSERKEILKGTFGLQSLCQITDCTEGRGIYLWKGVFYCVFRRGSQSVLFRVDPSVGTAAELGTITTSFTGPVHMVNNPTQLCIVDGVSGYTYTPSTGLFAQITDSAFPGALSITYLEGLGLFVQPNSIQWFYSNLFDFTTFPTGNCIGFESKAVDQIMGILMYQDEIIVLADSATEFWTFVDVGTSLTASPFQRASYGYIDFGCGAVGSPNTADGTVPNWISDKGQWIASIGYQGIPVSNAMFERALTQMTTFADARAYSWRDDNHIFTAMTFPTGGQTWVMDWTMKTLVKIQSYLADGSGWGRHRLNCIENDGTKLYGLDYENGTVYRVSRDYKDDDGNAIQRVLTSIEFEGGQDDLDFGSLYLFMKMGVGLISGQGSDPQVMRQFSNDSGQTWSNEMWRSCGAIGKYKQSYPHWNRNGVSRRRIEKFIFSDPVEWECRGWDYPMKRLA